MFSTQNLIFTQMLKLLNVATINVYMVSIKGFLWTKLWE